MKLLWIGTAAGLFLGTSALADDARKKDDPPKAQQGEPKTPKEKFEAAKKAMTAAQAEVNKIVGELRKKGEQVSLNNKELKAAFDASNKARGAVVEAAKALAQADPKSAEGFDALTYVLNFGGGSPDALKLLMEHHVDNPKIGSILGRIPTYTPEMRQSAEEFFRAVIEKNSNREAKGQATFALAQALLTTKKDEAEKLFAKVIAEYGDITLFRSTLGKMAEANLFELKHLQVGMIVPEIEGEDTDGKKFKLSDYRGKVVMLDFWGHW
jgi:hypothetical protein